MDELNKKDQDAAINAADLPAARMQHVFVPEEPPPFLSLAERDRRHKMIRERMTASGIDVLILPPNANRWEQCMADSRYVTGIGGFGTETLTIFPRDREPTAYLFNRSSWWRAVQQWIPDVRDGRNRWGRNITEHLKEIGFKGGTIGLSGLGGLPRTPDGIVPHRMVQAIMAIPGVKLIDATPLVQELRSIKSPEEVATLERSAAIADRMVAAMVRLARPGNTERQVYAAMVEAMIAEGGDLPALMIFASGTGVSHGQFVPTARVLKAGDLIANEIEARYAGYGAQTVAPLSLGKPEPAVAEAGRVALAAFEAVRSEMKPGATILGLMRTYQRTTETEGKGRFRVGFPLMHARGLGDEVPVVLDHDDLQKQGDIVLAENMVFVLKPRAISADGHAQVQLGDTVCVTPGGGRRLGRRELGLIVVG